MLCSRLGKGGALSWLVVELSLALACSAGPADDSAVARGRGLKTVALTPAAEASVLDAAIRASFNVEPGLVLLLHPRRLPPTVGYDGGDPMSTALVSVLHDRGIVRGLCEPTHDHTRDTARCPGQQAGYVVRSSMPFQVAADTIQINLAAEAYGAEKGVLPPALRFEKIYQLVGRGEQWRVVREARVRELR